MNDYEIIGWPEIQSFMECDGFDENATLINENDEMGIGSSTYLICRDWLESLNENESTEDEEYEDEDEQIQETIDEITDRLEGKDICEASDILMQYGHTRFTDEKIDDGCDCDGDTYVMMRSYDVNLPALGVTLDVRLYYGNHTRTISYIEISED